MGLADLVVGVLLLGFGRRLFWLFVGVIGFITGLSLGGRFFPDNATLALITGLALGVIGAGVSVFFQRVTVIVAGFLAGGYLAVSLLGMAMAIPAGSTTLPYIVGGILGAVLASVFFDWALIILSSLVGAVLAAPSIPIDPSLQIVLVAGLMIAGVVLQASLHLRTH
ncbi:MAG TPA: hypothetical protein VF813_00540 [Anaerolineaceae bacterium]